MYFKIDFEIDIANTIDIITIANIHHYYNDMIGKDIKGYERGKGIPITFFRKKKGR